MADQEKEPGVNVMYHASDAEIGGDISDLVSDDDIKAFVKRTSEMGETASYPEDIKEK
jgi:hypothetical protein